jgi:hypothetical protein
VVGAKERFAFQELETGKIVALQADLSPAWNDVFPPRHESIAAIARAAGWKVERIVFGWSGKLVATVTLTSESGGSTSLAATPATACRLALSVPCDVLIEDAALVALGRDAA